MNSPLLSDVMLSLNADVLKALAKRLGLPKTLTRKADMARELCGLVKERPADYVSVLSEVEQDFLAEAAHGDGWVDPSAFSAKYGTECFHPLSWVDSRKAYPLQLLLHGDDWMVGIPREVAGLFKQLLPKPAEVTVETARDLPETYRPPGPVGQEEDDARRVNVHEGERVVFQELRRILGLVQAGKIKVSPKKLRPTSATVKLLTKALAVPDFDLEMPQAEQDRWYEAGGACRAHAWGVLVQQCGWAKPKGSALALTPAGKAAVSSIGPEILREGFARFLKDDDFDEFNRIPNIRGQSGRAKSAMTRVSSRKHKVATALREWSVGEWISFDDAYTFQNASGNAFTVCGDADWFYFGSPDYGCIYDSDGLDQQYMRAVLMESLGTLGIVDLAYVYPHWLWPELGGSGEVDDLHFCGRYDGLLYVRLNELGAYCLGKKKTYTAPAPEALFKLLPNLDIAVVAADISPAEESMLDLYAKRKTERVWRLDRGRILNHLESGGTMKEVTQFLEAQADGDMPATVSSFLADIDLKASAVRGIEDAVIVQFADATTAALVAHDSAARKLCVRAGETGVAVPKRRERAFRAALKKLGFVIPHGA
jgi:hypothetical protein